MNKLLLILFFLSAVVLNGNAQENSQIEITGAIIDANTKEPVPYVHVVNKNSHKGTVSNTEGRFWMVMDKTDTVLFSSVGFESYAFTIKEQVKSNKLIVTIELNTSTMELQPVKIFAFKDEHTLKKAMLAMEVPIEEDHSRIELPGFYYGPKKEVKPNILSPFSLIHGKFSREVKERSKLAEYQQQEHYHNLIKAKYNEAVVLELTGLPEDQVEDFMEFCKLEENFLAQSSEYEIAVAVNKCLMDFNKLDE
ncbi:hypothetical protein C900_05583 [Fulvivirga imtechensis AK7]|uniref:TonB-dependent receptor n=1 Tax=Fulvivirga imtechensis AK7 TaxID=1237149 RepID=L8JJB6_9BACT|nr:carboxypeptidase-like regulatory domain-containing protein [Fulvivirga imtechensis]ELR68890.1 hypothetical protein C900_05583 [Fulvivirga imtechensis AK7]